MDIVGVITVVATILGGLAAVFYFWDRARSAKKRPTEVTSHEPTALSAFQAKPTDTEFAEKTYFRYRDLPCSLLESSKVVSYLESRYGCQAFRLGGRPLPVTVLWKNIDRMVQPENILGDFDATPPHSLLSSPILCPLDYQEARDYVRRQYEAPPSRVHYEGCDYRMVALDLSAGLPKLNGAFGLYYDNILTQYAMEWELKKALLRDVPDPVVELGRPGALPLREAVEALGNPLLSGTGRCAAMTISTLVVFARSDGHHYTILRRRSRNVGISPGMLHVVPAGMFEAANTQDAWSIETNIWRELLEEVYNEEEEIGSGDSELEDYLRGRSPINLLLHLLKTGEAEISITGICCDLLNLRPEICTVLFVKDPAFAEARRMVLNWEYEREGPTGTFALNWDHVDEIMGRFAADGGIVVSGAACLGLGREWLKARHGL